MKKVIKSLKDVPINGYLIIAVIALYCLNRFLLKEHTTGWVNYLLRCHFDDTICGTLIVAYSNVFLNVGNRAMIRLIAIVPFCFCVGLIWEFAAPLVRKGTTPDWIDVGCYVLGGILYWGIFMLCSRIDKKQNKKDDVSSE